MSSETPPDKNSDSSSDDFTKNLDYLQALTKSVSNFIYWLAKLLVTKNWVLLLSLVDVGLLIFFFPGKGVFAELVSGLLVFSGNYDKFFWLIFWVILLVALIIAIRTMPRPAPTLPDFTERKAIKGLRAFSQDDAEIFAQLQRERDLRECLESLTSNNFRFGILMGESGVGKSSFLQAGILPQLAREESSAQGIYIRFSNRDPFETVYQTLVKELEISEGSINQQNLLEIFSLAVASADKPLILIFDQFEQFFVHCKQKSDREPFIKGLKDWYLAANPLPIKILISIRGDLADRLVEIQKALGYSLSPQEVFRLDRFTPEEATKILQVIALAEELKFDEGFVRQLTAEELASREDGLISPVDLQVLAWTIEGQDSKELQAFSRNAFQKIGGIEGLMTRFLHETLEARFIESQKQAAIKVLLAMTDLDRNVRVGALTIEDLQQKMQGTLPASEIIEETLWLANPGVRLLTPVQEEGNTAYELAHERLIPALREVAGKELTSADKANQLLDRRVNEWLGNDNSSRYLFNWQELRLIRRQKPFLVWGVDQKKQNKEILLKLSWRRFYRQLGAVGMLLVFGLVGMGWWYSPSGQIQQVRWELPSLSARVSDGYREKAAIAFAKDESFKQAITISKSITNSYFKADVLTTIAETYSKLESFTEAANYLELALAAAQKITDSDDQARFLTTIAATYGQIENFPEAANSLKLAIAAAQEITDSSKKARVLTTIVATIGQIENFPEAANSLKLVIAAAQEITNSHYKARVLTTIAATIGQIENFPEAANSLKLVIATAQDISESYNKARVLTTIAATYGQIENFPEAANSFELLFMGQELTASYFKVGLLTTIAETYGKIDKFPDAANSLNLAITATESITDSAQKAAVLTTIIPVQTKLDRWREAHNAVSLCPTDECKVESLSLILTAWAEKKNPSLVENGELKIEN